MKYITSEKNKLPNVATKEVKNARKIKFKFSPFYAI
ncbi:hypothetical protein AF78_09940 [Aliarcobacter butzleri L353]|uniref:Uncharacterized protein n=1 Tax=Aliarcobacter butzleri L352 TaxID=1447260 RepID=A0A837JBN0_9BACT|nr:hypothetical protein AF78_09940 [Aliarcobacter butzleri L353]KLE04125.1 hypothetical protein AF77_07580 [Aliarcobacter butzleri L352]